MPKIAKLLSVIIVTAVAIFPFKALSGDFKSLNLQSNDIECVSCALNIKNNVSKITGVKKVEVSASAKKIHLEYDGDMVSENQIMQRIKSLGFKIEKIK